MRSEVGAGTEFTLYLALASGQENLAELPPKQGSAEGYILLVDDEAIVREITAEILRDAGYEVLSRVRATKRSTCTIATLRAATWSYST